MSIVIEISNVVYELRARVIELSGVFGLMTHGLGFCGKRFQIGCPATFVCFRGSKSPESSGSY